MSDAIVIDRENLQEAVNELERARLACFVLDLCNLSAEVGEEMDNLPIRKAEFEISDLLEEHSEFKELSETLSEKIGKALDLADELGFNIQDPRIEAYVGRQMGQDYGGAN